MVWFLVGGWMSIDCRLATSDTVLAVGPEKLTKPSRNNISSNLMNTSRIAVVFYTMNKPNFDRKIISMVLKQIMDIFKDYYVIKVNGH